MTGRSNDPANDNPGPSPVVARPCPICGKPAVERYKPFCSKHCADVDLGRWLGGRYAIPVENDDDDEDGIGGETGRKG